MRLAKTTDEIKKIHSAYARCHYLTTRNLTISFETDIESIRAILPPPLEPTAEPLGTAWAGDIGSSNCVGPFQGAALYIRARYGDIVGGYCVAMGLSDPGAVTFGREVFGEPAKLARMIFEEQDEYVWGSAERHGIRYLSLRGRMAEAGAIGRQENSFFSFKYLPRADGPGFDTPPVLVHTIADVTVKQARSGRGELIFRDSAHDPVADLPIRQVIEATYTDGHSYRSARALCQVDPEAFLPYAFSKVDAFELVAEGTFLHSQAARKTREGKGRWREAAVR